MNDGAVPDNLEAAAVGIAIIRSRRIVERQLEGVARSQAVNGLLNCRVGVAGLIIERIGIELDLRCAVLRQHIADISDLDFERRAVSIGPTRDRSEHVERRIADRIVLLEATVLDQVWVNAGPPSTGMSSLTETANEPVAESRS